MYYYEADLILHVTHMKSVHLMNPIVNDLVEVEVKGGFYSKMRAELIIVLHSPKPAGYDQQAGATIKANWYT